MTAIVPAVPEPRSDREYAPHLARVALTGLQVLSRAAAIGFVLVASRIIVPDQWSVYAVVAGGVRVRRVHRRLRQHDRPHTTGAS